MMTEWDIICLMRRHFACRSQFLIIPNSHVFGWEADLLRITRAGLCHEYEIKLRRNDFLVDAQKEKHLHIDNYLKQVTETPTLFNGIDRGRKIQTIRPANYFWYIALPGIIKKEELPRYAGLIELHLYDDGPYVPPKPILKAPMLHKEKISEVHKMQLLKSMTVRFWNARLNITNEN